MFKFLKDHGKNKTLEALLQSVQANVSNNYKDAAQESLKEFEETLGQMEAAGKLGGKQAAYYEEQLADYKKQMKNFTHKDQKPYWV